MKKVGFLGMGIMGAAMAENLVKAGYKLVVWNRTPEKCGPLVRLGAKRADTPGQVADECDITFAALADPDAALAVTLGKQGVVDGIGDGRGYVEISTVDEGISSMIGKAVRERGGRFLEAPVTGSKDSAVEGNLVFLAAGDRLLYDESLPAFEVMGKRSFFLGDVGKGVNMKLAVNMVLGVMMSGFCEGHALADKAGLSRELLIEVLGLGVMSNPMFAMKGASILNGDYSPHFPLKHMQKDLRLVIGLGDGVGQPLMTAALANEAFKRAKEAGLGEEDFSAIYKTLGGR